MTGTDDTTERDVREVMKPGAMRHERRRILAERARTRRHQRRRELFVCSLALRHHCKCQQTEETPDAPTTTTEEETNS